MYNLAIFMFKNHNSELFETTHSYDTRTRNLPSSTFQRLTLTQHSIYFKGPTVWNSLPPTIQEASTLNQFKILVKNHLINSYALLLGNRF